MLLGGKKWRQHISYMGSYIVRFWNLTIKQSFPRAELFSFLPAFYSCSFRRKGHQMYHLSLLAGQEAWF